MARRYRSGDYRVPAPRIVNYRTPPFPPFSRFDDPHPHHFPPPFPPPVPFPPHRSDSSIHFTNQAIQAHMFMPISPREMFLERERLREIVREEMMRDEARRRFVEEEVRREIAMERRYRVRNGFANPNPNPNPNPNHKNCSCSCKCAPPVIINLEESENERELLCRNTNVNLLDGNKEKGPLLIKDQCEKAAESSEANRKNDKAVAEIQSEENKGQCEKEAESSGADGNDDKPVAVAEAKSEENKGQSEKEAESSGPKRNVKYLPITNSEEMRRFKKNQKKQKKREKREKRKSAQKEFNCVICKISVCTELTWMVHLNGKKHRTKAELACFAKPDLKEEPQLEQNKDQCEKEAESSVSKRKAESLSTNTEVVKKSKKQKSPLKEFNCVICQFTDLTTELSWSYHLNGKKHKNKAEKYYADNPNLKEKLEEKNTEEKSEELILKEEPFVKEVASNSDIQPTKKKILVKGEEIVVKNNRLFCESCGFNCSTTMMMEIHLGSEKHKANSELQITQINKIA